MPSVIPKIVHFICSTSKKKQLHTLSFKPPAALQHVPINSPSHPDPQSVKLSVLGWGFFCQQAFLPVDRALYAAGMRDGDVITMVDGLPATQETLGTLGGKAHTPCVSFFFFLYCTVDMQFLYSPLLMNTVLLLILMFWRFFVINRRVSCVFSIFFVTFFPCFGCFYPLKVRLVSSLSTYAGFGFYYLVVCFAFRCLRVADVYFINASTFAPPPMMWCIPSHLISSNPIHSHSTRSPFRSIPSHLIPTNPILPHPVPSNPIPSRPAPPYPTTSYCIPSHTVPLDSAPTSVVFRGSRYKPPQSLGPIFFSKVNIYIIYFVEVYALHLSFFICCITKYLHYPRPRPLPLVPSSPTALACLSQPPSNLKKNTNRVWRLLFKSPLRVSMDPPSPPNPALPTLILAPF